METLVLLDTHALIHRAYHALPRFTSKKTGEPTGALYGLSAMLIKILREIKPDYISAAVDLPGPTFRHNVYKEYKAQRPDVDDELISQLNRAKDLLKAFGIEILSAPGFEADDVLGTIVEKLNKVKNKNLRTIIVSGDMDILQLVDGEKVVVYAMRKGMDDIVVYDEKKVEERFGFGPKLLPDYKGLRGDPSDNITGVRGIGEKTASNIIQNFGTIEDLYNKLRKGEAAILKDKVITNLLDHEEDAMLSKMLATIRRDAPVDFAIPSTTFSINKPEATKIFDELGFSSLISRLDNV